MSKGPHFVYHNSNNKITNLWKFRLNRSLESGENNGKTHPRFYTFRHVMTCVLNKSVILASENWYCFNVFSKSKAFHGIIFQDKSFTITFCKPCNLFVNLWTFNFCSVQKVFNEFNRHFRLINHNFSNFSRYEYNLACFLY